MNPLASNNKTQTRPIEEEEDKSEEAELISQIRTLQLRLTQLVQSPVSSSAHESPRKLSRSSRALRRYESTPVAHTKRLLVVANRLPISLHKDSGSGEWDFNVSSGGLVSALTSIKDIAMVWIGWPGAIVEDLEERERIGEKLKRNNYYPVWLPKNVAHQYYSGYSNAVLWPLFHYISLPIQDLYSSEGLWEAYDDANRHFASTVLNVYQKGDLVWVHDYHLMLLPGMLRAGRPHMKIGFFLHTPFPSSEIYRVLPQREEILQGLLSSDLIGFHIYDYARHFKSACTRILGVEVNANKVNHGGVSSIVGTFPIGIDPTKFTDALKSPEVQGYLQELTEQFSGRKIIIGIDRLDYIKGIPHKLYAMERFFQNNPEWVGKVVMVQIAIPSRTDVKEYQRLARETHEIVGRINGRFGSLSKVPIHYLDQTIPFARMCALYRIADVCINTSLRDGMNLVSYEYVACQQENSGVLILSEFAGAAQSLGAGCLRVNPWDIDEVANAIQEALTMSDDERKLYQNYCFKYIEEHTAQVWAESFVSSLERCTISNSKSIIPPKLSFESVCDKFSRSSGHRLIILGLVGTITQKRKEGLDYETYSRVIKINPEIAKSLSTLSNSKRTSIVIITSRGKDVCEKACSGCGAWVAAENGYFLQNPGSSVWEEFYGACDLDWMDEVEEVFNYFCDRTPKSFIEREQTSITWHYKDCDAEFSELQARDLLIHLKSGPLINTATEVVHSNKLVQVRPSGVSKGHTVEKLIQRIHSSDPVGFILCLGNFLGRDEDVFVTLEGKSLVEMSRSPRRVTEYLSDEVEVVSVTIGARSTAAKNYIRTIADVQNLLFFLCQVCEAEGSISSQLTKSISAPALNIRIPRTASLPDILEISKNSQIMDHQADSYT